MYWHSFCTWARTAYVNNKKFCSMAKSPLIVFHSIPRSAYRDLEDEEKLAQWKNYMLSVTCPHVRSRPTFLQHCLVISDSSKTSFALLLRSLWNTALRPMTRTSTSRMLMSGRISKVIPNRWVTQLSRRYSLCLLAKHGWKRPMVNKVACLFLFKN